MLHRLPSSPAPILLLTFLSSFILSFFSLPVSLWFCRSLSSLSSGLSLLVSLFLTPCLSLLTCLFLPWTLFLSLSSGISLPVSLLLSLYSCICLLSLSSCLSLFLSLPVSCLFPSPLTQFTVGLREKILWKAFLMRKGFPPLFSS